jgi:2'-5' RNA ligase
VTDRLFFALWPDDRLRTELAGRVAVMTEGYACKPQRPDQWHLTVEFLGSVAAARQPALHECATGLEGFLHVPEVIVLDRMEYWKRPQVLCVTAQVVPPRVMELVAALKSELEKHGFEPERRKFRPHLTLARKARPPLEARAVQPILWPVRSLSLVRSISDTAGSRYEPLMDWNLLVKALIPTPSR